MSPLSASNRTCFGILFFFAQREVKLVPPPVGKHDKVCTVIQFIYDNPGLQSPSGRGAVGGQKSATNKDRAVSSVWVLEQVARVVKEGQH